MPQPPLRVLLIEDNPGDAELVKEALADLDDTAFEVHWVEALLPALDWLARGDIDLVLLDVSLPDSHGLDGLNAVRVLSPNLPVVLLTGWDNESLALRAVQSGAQDYLVKGKLQGPDLARTLQRAIVRHKISGQSSHGESRPEQGKVVGILGVKGGVGATTVACHLARELKRQTLGRVLVADLDLAGNTLGFLMDKDSPYGIADASEDILHLDQDRWSKLAVSEPGGLDLILSRGPALREEKQPRAERVRFVLHFVRSLYEWIIVDLGRLNPFSVRVAEELDSLHLVSTCDVLGLNEAKSVVRAMVEAGVESNRLSLILNQVPARPLFSEGDLEKLLAVPVEAMLPECRQDFATSLQNGKRLGESRKFQKHVAELAAGIAGVVGKEAPATKNFLPLLIGAFRGATVRN